MGALRSRFRVLACAGVAIVLAACAGTPPSKVVVVHDEGVCAQVERESADVLALKLCNCSGRTIWLSADAVPWNPLAYPKFQMTFDGAAIPARDIEVGLDPFTDQFHQLAHGECVAGKIRLAEMFAVGDRDLAAPGWNLRWTGTIPGSRESWNVTFEYPF